MSWLRDKRWARLARYGAAAALVLLAILWAALALVEPAIQLCRHDAKGAVTTCSPPGPKQLWWVAVVTLLLVAPDLKLGSLEINIFGLGIKAEPQLSTANTALAVATAVLPERAPTASEPTHWSDLATAAATVGDLDRLLAVRGGELSALSISEAMTLRARLATDPKV